MEAYFAGPDGRYRGQFWRVGGADVLELAEALEEGWGRLTVLDAALPADGEYKLAFRCGLTLHVRSRYPGQGISLTSYNGLLRTEAEIKSAVAELRGLPDEAALVQQRLVTI